MAREMVYDFRTVGAEETAARIRALNEEFKRGGIGLEDYGRKKRELRSESRSYMDTFRLETQLWLAAHPNVQKLTQAVSVFSGVMHTALAIQNAWNLAMLVTQGQQAAVVEASAAVAQAERELALARQSGDPAKIVEAEEKLGIARARQAEQARQQAQAEQGLIATMLIGFGVLTAEAIRTGSVIAAHWGSITGALSGLGTTLLSLGPLFAAAFGFFLGTELRDSSKTFLESLQSGWDNFIKGQITLGNDWIGWYTIDLPAAWAATQEAFVAFGEAIAAGWIVMINSLITGLNAGISLIAQGFTALANIAIDAINRIIKGINKLVEWTGIKLSLVPSVNITAPQIPLISAATGFEGKLGQDTMFQAHKGEFVSITPAAQVGSGGGPHGNTYIFQVSGNMITFRELLDEIDEHRQRDIRDRK